MALTLMWVAAVVMNGIAWDCAFSLFPRATFLRQQGLVTILNVKVRDQAALAKYHARGFRLAREWALVGADELDNDFMPMRDRRVGDRGCWMLYFDPPAPPPLRSADRVQYNTFRVWSSFVGLPGQLRVATFAMDAVALCSRLLTHRYTAPIALCTFAEGILARLEGMAKDLGWGDELAAYMSFVRM